MAKLVDVHFSDCPAGCPGHPQEEIDIRTETEKPKPRPAIPEVHTSAKPRPAPPMIFEGQKESATAVQSDFMSPAPQPAPPPDVVPAGLSNEVASPAPPPEVITAPPPEMMPAPATELPTKPEQKLLDYINAKGKVNGADIYQMGYNRAMLKSLAAKGLIDYDAASDTGRIKPPPPDKVVIDPTPDTTPATATHPEPDTAAAPAPTPPPTPAPPPPPEGMGVNLFGDLQALPSDTPEDADDGSLEAPDTALDPWERRERAERIREAERELTADAPILTPDDIPPGPAAESDDALFTPAPPGGWDETDGACMPSDHAVICRVNPDDLATAPELFQYKEYKSETGEIGTLANAPRWDPDLAGIAYIWQANDGQLYIVDGHQRLGLAKRMKAAGQEDVYILGKIWKESDGFSAQNLRLRAAKKNISEGSGTAVDAARVLRQDPKLLDAVSRDNALARDARGIAKLDDEAFQLAATAVNAGKLDAYSAAVVGESTDRGRMKDPRAQTGAIQTMIAETAKDGKLTQVEAQELLNEIKDNLQDVEIESLQGGFAGMQAAVLDSAWRERADLKVAARKRFAEDRRLYNKVVRGDSKLEQAGNILDKESNETEAERAAAAEKLFEGAAATGALGRWLNAAAKDLQAQQLTGGKRKAYITQSINELTPYLERWDSDGQDALWEYADKLSADAEVRLEERNRKIREARESGATETPETEKPKRGRGRKAKQETETAPEPETAPTPSTSEPDAAPEPETAPAPDVGRRKRWHELTPEEQEQRRAEAQAREDQYRKEQQEKRRAEEDRQAEIKRQREAEWEKRRAELKQNTPAPPEPEPAPAPPEPEPEPDTDELAAAAAKAAVESTKTDEPVTVMVGDTEVTVADLTPGDNKGNPPPEVAEVVADAVKHIEETGAESVTVTAETENGEIVKVTVTAEDAEAAAPAPPPQEKRQSTRKGKGKGKPDDLALTSIADSYADNIIASAKTSAEINEAADALDAILDGADASDKEINRVRGLEQKLRAAALEMDGVAVDGGGDKPTPEPAPEPESAPKPTRKRKRKQDKPDTAEKPEEQAKPEKPERPRPTPPRRKSADRPAPRILHEPIPSQLVFDLAQQKPPPRKRRQPDTHERQPARAGGGWDEGVPSEIIRNAGGGKPRTQRQHIPKPKPIKAGSGRRKSGGPCPPIPIAKGGKKFLR